MKLTVIKNLDNQYVLERNNEVILITNYTSRLLDIIEDVLEHDGKLTLIPEPKKEHKCESCSNPATHCYREGRGTGHSEHRCACKEHAE